MTRLSITSAWEETAAILKRDFGLLFLIAFGFAVLPQLALQALAPAGEPQGGVNVLLPILFAMVLLIGMVGNIAIAALAIGRESVVGNAIRLGFKRALPLFLATLLLVVGIVLLTSVISAVNGVTPENMFQQPGQPSPAAARTILILFVFIIALGTRFLLTTQVAAAETGGPVAILRRSWSLTKGHYWRLLGFFLLMMIAFLLISMAVVTVVGTLAALVAGPLHPGSLGALIVLLVAGLFNAAFVVVFLAMLSRIYVLVAGSHPPATDATP
jgi:hypothetical protein